MFPLVPRSVALLCSVGFQQVVHSGWTTQTEQQFRVAYQLGSWLPGPVSLISECLVSLRLFPKTKEWPRDPAFPLSQGFRVRRRARHFDDNPARRTWWLHRFTQQASPDSRRKLESPPACKTRHLNAWWRPRPPLVCRDRQQNYALTSRRRTRSRQRLAFGPV